MALTSPRGAKRVSLVMMSLGSAPKTKRIAEFSDADIVRFDWVGDERLVFCVMNLKSASGPTRS